MKPYLLALIRILTDFMGTLMISARLNPDEQIKSLSNYRDRLLVLEKDLRQTEEDEDG